MEKTRGTRGGNPLSSQNLILYFISMKVFYPDIRQLSRAINNFREQRETIVSSFPKQHYNGWLVGLNKTHLKKKILSHGISLSLYKVNNYIFDLCLNLIRSWCRSKGLHSLIRDCHISILSKIKYTLPHNKIS